MRDHRKLRAFVLADEVALETYGLTVGFPREEMYGLTSQMRRAAVSAPSNIVEGCSRSSQPDYLRFLEIAFGSLRELHYQFTLAKRLGFCDDSKARAFESLILETEKVLNSLIRAVRKPPQPSTSTPST